MFIRVIIYDDKVCMKGHFVFSSFRALNLLTFFVSSFFNFCELIQARKGGGGRAEILLFAS